MVASLALALALHVEPAISVWIPGAPVDQVVKILGAETSQDLRCDGALRGRIVMASLDGAEPEDVLQRLADLLNATWRAQDGSRILVPDAEKQAKARSAKIASRASDSSSLFKKLDEINSADYDAAKVATALRNELQAVRGGQGDNSMARMMEMMRTQATVPWSMPVGRLTAKVVSSVPKESYLGLSQGNRIVFSTRPNRRQSKLPVNVSEIENQWRSDTLAAAQALKQMPENNEDDNVASFGVSAMPKAPIDRILFSVSHLEHVFMSMLMGSVVVLDRQDNVLANNSFNLWVGSGSEIMMGISSKPELNDPVELSELSKNQAGVAALLMANEQANTKEQEASVCGQPDRYEPLSLVPSEIIRASLSKRHKNFMVELTDDMMFLLILADPSGKTNFKIADRIVDSLLTDRIEDSGDWFMARPADTDSTLDTRIPRGPMAQVWRQLSGGSGLTLDQFAEYLLARPRNVGATILELFTFATVADGDTVFEQFQNFQDLNRLGEAAIRVYGRLNRAERANFLNSGSYAVGRGPNAIKAEIEREIYLGSILGPFQYESEADTGPGFGMEEAPPPPRAPKYYEPTDAFPDGLPGNTVIRVEIKREVTMLEPGPAQNLPWVEVSTDDLAIRLAAVREPVKAKEVLGDHRLQPLPAQVRLTNKTTYTFRVIIGERPPSAERKFSERAPASTAAEVKFALIPKAIRDEVEAKSAEIIKSWNSGDLASEVTIDK
ncbi:MAG: hypothetical protein KF884_06080 [Fimbriimonadaceae bacterium]|nr:hypothetical protein [Fimbriimonadaceae bacterium]QYK59653.1 MAG: hypothetical protein KF884_06080 [Fimbriimonadaceae bacterium]